MMQKLKIQSLAEIKAAKTKEALEKLRVSYLGRKGKINQLLKKIKDLPLKKRIESAKEINKSKKAIENALKNQILTVSHPQTKAGSVQGRQLPPAMLDPTLPGFKPPIGHLHLVSYAISEISQIFEHIGFTRVSYPEVEYDWYAFEGLNMPENHPARDEWETFFIDAPSHPKLGQIVLTPHTSSGQLREMISRQKLPIRMINIAKCYRRQSDISHIPMFYQFEGLVVDKDIAITHLKGTLDYFVKQFFGPERKSRIRPFHFQFTEPSLEVDVSCDICQGRGVLNKNNPCRLCKNGWLELGGAGMVHPQVLKNGGIDSQKYSGFAFGWGVERTYMMKSGLKIDDIRILYSNDLRFLQQF